ncbi:hypothetical protein Tco_0582827, partial [Tanacetum coccineum]
SIYCFTYNVKSTSAHQQALVDVGSETRPPMFERGSYVPWSSSFLRYIDRKRETRNFLQHSIDKSPYQMKEIPATDIYAIRTQNEDDLTSDDLKQYEEDIEAMNLILISIPNDIYNSVDACQNARDMWNRVKRLMQGTKLGETERESRFVNEFDKINVEPGESLSSVYVINVRLAKNLKKIHMICYLIIFNNMKVVLMLLEKKRAAKTHNPLALMVNSFQSPAAYYVTHPPSVVYYDDDYQVDAVCDDQEDRLTTTIILLAHAITQRYSTPTNKRLRTSSNTRNQAVVQADRVNIKDINVGNDGRFARRSSNTQGESAKSENVHKETGNGNPRVRDSKYFMKQMLLAKKDEVGVILYDEHNDFILANAPEMEDLKDLSANICMMARIQKADSDFEDGPSYDSAFISEVCSLETLMRLHSSTRDTEGFKRLVAYAKCNRDSYGNLLPCFEVSKSALHTTGSDQEGANHCTINVDEEREIKAPPGFKPQPPRGTEGQAIEGIPSLLAVHLQETEKRRRTLSPRKAPAAHRSPMYEAYHSNQQLHMVGEGADGLHGEANLARNNMGYENGEVGDAGYMPHARLHVKRCRESLVE